MAKTPGLFRRNGTYYLRVMIPTSMRASYAGRSKIIRSLGTARPSEARLAAAVVRAQTLLALRPLNARSSPKPLWNAEFLITDTRPCATVTLRAVFDRWKQSQPRSPDSLAACGRALTLFECVFGADKDLGTLTRTEGDEFRSWLLKPDRNTTSKTARDRFIWIKTLLKYAFRELECIAQHRWEGLDIETVGSKRRPWTQAELKLLFGQPLFLNGALPTDVKAGKAAAYWIPLLGAYHGARVSELAQLRPENIFEHDGVQVFRITDEGDDQKVKTEASGRLVPIHSELLRLGFLGYVEQLKADAASSLWPHLPKRTGKPGGFFSHWFGTYRRQIGIESKYPDFHCFRHTVRTALAEAGVAEPQIDLLVGHEVGGSTGARVYTHHSIRALKRSIEHVKYPLLKLRPTRLSTGEA